jgi:hypothetical protein
VRGEEKRLAISPHILPHPQSPFKGFLNVETAHPFDILKVYELSSVHPPPAPPPPSPEYPGYGSQASKGGEL